MDTSINVREILGVKENKPLFIKPSGPDKHAAATRLAETEKHFEEWHAAINRTNTRELPAALVKYYDEAAYALCMVLTLEREIVNYGGK